MGVLTVDEKISSSSNHFYRNLGSGSRLTIDSSDSYFEDMCFPGKMWQRLIDVEVLLDSDI